MSTFGPFSLGRAVVGSGAAQVVRARRFRGGHFEAPVHLARADAPTVVQRLIATAEALAQTRHEQVARIHEVGLVEGTAYAVAEPAEGVDLRALVEHLGPRRAATDSALAVAVALALARVAAELADRDVWSGARGVGLSSLFAAGLRLDAVVLAKDGVRVRPLVGAFDDPALPTPFRAPEIDGSSRPATTATDVFLVAQVLRALCVGDAHAHEAPRLGPHAAALAPLLAGGLTPRANERLSLAALLTGLARALEEQAGAEADLVIARALDGELGALAALGAQDPEPEAADLRAAAAAPAPRVAWPSLGASPARAARSVPAFLLEPSAPDQEAVERVFTDEGAPAPSSEGAGGDAPADEPTEKLARPALRTDGASTMPSDPPWLSSDELVVLEETERRAAAPATPRIATLAEGGLTTEALSPFDDEKTE
ncbi:MAG: hypothetical protein IT383_18610 [Deltaproteobacteria bacterium]|nr:hypothetical protein [Deltaproteobacteria bacterium]